MAVIGHAASFAPGASVPWHRHRRGQLALTLARVMRVETPDKVWLVPRGAVLWLPAGTPHRSLAPEQRLMRSLYVLPDAAGALPAAPTAVEQGTPLADMLTWLAETYDSDRLDKAWSTVAGAALALVALLALALAVFRVQLLALHWVQLHQWLVKQSCDLLRFRLPSLIRLPL